MIKNGKATGTNDNPIEELKAFDEHNLEVVTELCNKIYNSGYIPTDMKQSIFIPLPKKPKAQKCTEFRTISLMTHISKLLLKSIQQRIADKIDKGVSRLQSGFRPEMGTSEGIWPLVEWYPILKDSHGVYNTQYNSLVLNIFQSSVLAGLMQTRYETCHSLF